ncbi:MAG TPA: hypothetical protein VNL71_03240 [Chloroflexota bacterium]|nr:hypothetical protein [Chloroflexota bacterium]
MGHDQIFKDLLPPFFLDFLRLFLPEVAQGIKPESITAMPTEVFTDIPDGEQRTGDLLTQVEPLDGPPELVLIHTEVQGEEGPEFPYRVWEYNALYTLRYKKPVISIELAPFAKSGKVELVRYSQTLFGQSYARLDYWRIPLGALPALEYVAAEPVLGAALAVLMRAKPGERVDLKVAALERILAGRLDAARQYLLVNFIESYLALGDAEQAAYERRVSQGGHMAIKELEMTWGDRLRMEGRAEGEQKGRAEGALAAKRDVLLDVVRTRFGAVPDALAAQAAQEDETWLTQMLRRAATASSLEELTSQ